MRNYIKIAFWNFAFLGLIFITLELLFVSLRNKKFSQIQLDKLRVEKIAYKNLKKEYELLNKKCDEPRIIANDQAKGNSINFAKDFTCPSITVLNSKRVTVGSNQNAIQKVHVYGGSTIFGQGTIDSGTIPSKLQSFIKENKNISVVNHGFGSLVLNQQIDRLKNTDIKKKDIIVFYDGGNDAFHSYVYNNNEGNIIGFNRKNVVNLKLSQLRYFLSKNSAIYNYLSLLKHKDKNKKRNCEFLPNYTEEEINNKIQIYLQKIIKVDNYVRSKGAYFYHFLQPILDYNSNYLEDDYYRTLLRQSNFEPCLAKNINNFYDKLSAQYTSKLSSVNAFDISSIFKSTNKNDYKMNLFIDWIHVNSIANSIISEEIFSRINISFKK